MPLSMPNQLKCLAEEITGLEKALRGQGAYGGVNMETATETQKEVLRESLMSSKTRKMELEQQLRQNQQQQHLQQQQQQQQPHQAPDLFGHGSGSGSAPSQTADTQGQDDDAQGTAKAADKNRADQSTTCPSSGTGRNSNNQSVKKAPAAQKQKKQRHKKTPKKKQNSSAGGAKRKASVPGGSGGGGGKRTAASKVGGGGTGSKDWMTPPMADFRSTKQEGPPAEPMAVEAEPIAVELQFRHEKDWQRMENMTIAAMKMCGKRPERSVVRRFMSAKFGKPIEEVTDLANSLTEAAEDDGQALWVDVDKLVDLCCGDGNASKYVLGGSTNIAKEVGRKNAIALRFRRYSERCDLENSEAQMEREWQGPDGLTARFRKNFLKARVQGFCVD